jgi:hypothetical protein
VQQTIDGGYVVAGYSTSYDGDVVGNHPGVVSPAQDFWIIKLDPIGTLQWQKCLGGNIQERAYDIKQTSDYGFIIAGFCSSNNGDVTGFHGNDDYWIVKLDSSGGLEWQKALGGTSVDRAQSVLQTPDGGYIAAGFTSSINGDVTDNHGSSSDYWIVKLNASGNIQWKKCYGSSGSEAAYSIAQTMDNGFVVAGIATANGGDVTGFHGSSDYWIVKLDSAGVLQWQQSYGGSASDDSHSVSQIIDGGFILSGSSNSVNGDVTGNHGDLDYWLVKLSNPTIIDKVIKEQDFIMYPNPVIKEVNIEFFDLNRNGNLTIKNILGQTIKQIEDIDAPGNITITLDLTELPRGLYFVQLNTDKESTTKKFIKN